jgi:hypothetical protein
LRHVSPWQGNINPSPFFGDSELRAALGPANPWPKIVAKEPWPFRRRGYPPLYCCYYHRDLQSQPVHGTSRPRFYPAGTPPYPHPSSGGCAGVSAAGLSPVYLRGPAPRRMSCYTLLRGWLLLGPPFRCLRHGTLFDTLSRHLGALTPVRVVPLSAYELIP